MEINEMIHWHEGLFLQPHHLQQLQLGIANRAVIERQIFSPYPYGITEAVFSEGALETFAVQVERLTAIMPSGQMVMMPGNAEIPALNLRQLFQDSREQVTVYLAVPIYTTTGGNTVEVFEEEQPQSRHLYTAKEKEVRDENTGDNPQQVQVRQVNARLLTSADAHDDFELLPLLQISPVSDESTTSPIKIDSLFIPPLLHVKANTSLSNILLDLLDQMKSTRDDLVGQLNRTGFNPELLSGIQLDRVLRLQAMNKHTAIVESLLLSEVVHPYTMYLQLRGLLGEVAALQPSRDLYAVPPYDHDNCHPVFRELISRIRSLIAAEGSGSYIKLDFVQDETSGIWTVELRDEHLIKAEDYFIAVQYQDSPQKVIQLIEGGDQFKLTATSQAHARVRGVKLKEERYPPSILPAVPNALWFKLLRAESQRTWSKIRDEKKISAVWSESVLPRLQVSLYLTVFEDKASK